MASALGGQGKPRFSRLRCVTPPSAEDVAAVSAALLAGSEVLSLLPGVRANGWVQLILGALQGISQAGGQNKRQRQRRGRR